MFVRILFAVLLILPIYMYADVKILKVVNGEAISNLDVKKRVKLTEKLSGKVFTQAEYNKMFNESLEALINEIIFAKKAQEMNIEVLPIDTHKKLEILAQQNSIDLDQYLQKYNINYDDIIQKITTQIIFERIIELEIVPHITVSDDEINAFSNKMITIFELANTNNYLGLFSATDLSSKVLNTTRKMNIGDTDDRLKITLLDRFNVRESDSKAKFDIIEISSDDKNNLKRLSAQSINCQNYTDTIKEIEKFKVAARAIISGKGSIAENKLYKKLLKNNTLRKDNISIISDDSLILICDIIKNEYTESEIQNKIFQNKLIIQTETYIKNLRRNSSIV